MGELVPGLGEELNTEFSILLLMTYLGLYGLGFHWSTGRRISVEEAAVFNAYVAATAIICTALMTLTPESMTWVLLAELALFIYVGGVVPYKVLPRLYPSRSGGCSWHRSARSSARRCSCSSAPAS